MEIVFLMKFKYRSLKELKMEMWVELWKIENMGKLWEMLEARGTRGPGQGNR